MSLNLRMLIGGRLVAGSGSFKVINPSTGEPFAEAPTCSQAQLDEAVSAAGAAFPAWAARQLQDRQKMMVDAAGKIQQDVKRIAEVIVREQGKPLKAAKGEVMGCCAFMTYFGTVPYEYEKVLVENDQERVIQRRMPLGVVAGITPWNFPAMMAAWKFAESLVLGNTIVLKPSPYTPLSTLLIGELLADAFPPGVLNIVSGDDQLGRWMTEHKGVAKVSFTGSTRTGKVIQAAASSTLKRLTLELGGNDAAIVLDDAEPELVAPKIFGAAMGNSGQVCIAAKRLYVHESKFDEVVNRLTSLAKNSKVGDGFGEGVEFGPINNKMQFDRVCELVEDAKRQGAKVHVGGAPIEGPGYMYPLTILTGVQEGTRIVDEEQFGPVLPVIPFKDVDDVVARANATNYGLGASVWGTDAGALAHVASRLDAGTVWVNSHATLTPDVAFGGIKESGVGRQMGEGTLEGNTQTKIIRSPKAKSKL